MSVKSKLYELIQLSQNDKYPIGLSRPEFDDTDDFDQSTNTHHMTCTATIEIDGKNETFKSDVFPNKKDANQNACLKIYEHITNLEKETGSKKQNRSKNNTVIKVEPEDEICIDKHLMILIDYENVSMEKELVKLMKFLDRVCVFAPDAESSETEELYSASEDEDSENASDSEEPSSDSEELYGIEVIKFAGHSSSMKARTDVVVKSTRKDAVDHYIGFYLGKALGEYPTMADTHSIHILSKDHFASCLEDFCPNVTHNVDVDHLIESITELAN